MFYPANPNELQEQVRTYLEESAVDIPAPKAIIAPHAGYIYSGPIAVNASIETIKNKIKHVTLLGPAHRTYLDGRHSSVNLYLQVL